MLFISSFHVYIFIVFSLVFLNYVESFYTWESLINILHQYIIILLYLGLGVGRLYISCLVSEIKLLDKVSCPLRHHTGL
jgi:hypothetical protein